MESEHTHEYPFDTDSLKKGSTVSVDLLEQSYNVRRGTDAFGLAVLQAQNFIARRFLDRGEIVVVTRRKYDLYILLDEEVPKHQARSARNGFRKAARARLRMAGADRSLMSDGTRNFNDREIVVLGRQLSAVRRERRILPPGPTARTTPGLKKLAP